MKKIIPILLVAAAIAGAAYYLMSPKVMPLEMASSGEFQKAKSHVMETFRNENRGYSQPVEDAMATRAAITAMGYDPDETIMYWMSPAFRDDLNKGDPDNLINSIRLSDRLIAITLGDQATDSDFEKIVESFSPEISMIARNRRASLITQ